MHQHTVFELTKNDPPQRRAGLGGAIASLRTLLRPLMRALPALALVGALALSLGAQAAQAQQVPPLGSLLLGLPDLQAQASASTQEQANPPGNEHQAAATNQAGGTATWAWYYTVYDPNPSGGPNGRYSYALGLFFGDGGFVQMQYVIDIVGYQGGWLHHDRHMWDWIGYYAVQGSVLVITGQGYRTDVSNWNPRGNGRYPIAGTYQFQYKFLSPTKLQLITPDSFGFKNIPHWGSATIVLNHL